MRNRIAVMMVIVQTILLLAHAVVYATWMNLTGGAVFDRFPAAKAVFALLAFSFVASSLLAFRYFNGPVRVLYTISAVWLGMFSFFFWAAAASWLVYGGATLFGAHVASRTIAFVLFGIAAAVGVYALVNALWIRVRKISVKLPNLPPSWNGRVAALVSDVHLGHVRGRGFAQRIVQTLRILRPDVVFITGDLFDGTQTNAARITKPLANLAPPLGSFFVAGNHEEFHDPAQYLEAVRSCGIRVLNNEKVSLDGVDLVGVQHRVLVRPEAFRNVLRDAALQPDRPSILLAHAPDQLAIAEEAGISLQLSGHTHRGQFFPWTWITSRIYGPFVYGLNRLGKLLIYTTTGAGTWGPPMRLGAAPELVLIQFES